MAYLTYRPGSAPVRSRRLTKNACAVAVAALIGVAGLSQATVAHALVITEVTTPLSPFGIAVLGSDTYFTQSAPQGCTVSCPPDGIDKLVNGVGTPQLVTTLPANSNPQGLVAGPDGALWFTEQGLTVTANKIGRVTPAGVLTTTDIPTAQAGAIGITVGPDNNIWFAETKASKIGRLVPCAADGCTVNDVLLPGGTVSPLEIAAGPTNTVWFTERDTSSIGEISAAAGPLGTARRFVIPTVTSKPYGITLGPDHNIWFTEHTGNRVGRVNVTRAMSGAAVGCTLIDEFVVPTPGSAPFGITAAPDGNLWFVEQQGNNVAQISTAGVFLGEIPIPTPNSQPVNLVSAGTATTIRVGFTESLANQIGYFNPPAVPAGGNGYVLDGYGGLHPYTSGGAAVSAAHITGYWSGWNIARSVAVAPGCNSGYVLDGLGGIHPFTTNTSNAWGGGSLVGAYFGFDIARDIVVRPDGRSGYVLDGYGGIHPWYVNGVPAATPNVTGTAYWTGWDIARRIVLNPADPSGESGYVLDAYGGLHSFSGPDTGVNQPIGINSGATGAYFGFQIARDVALTANGAGYLLDGWGGVHPVGTATRSTFQSDTTYWRGWDIARGLVVTSAQTGAFVLDGYGGVHPIGDAPPVATTGYWAGWDIAKNIRGVG